VKLSLHVGMGKSGSTALQKFLGDNAVFLKQNRCFYLGRVLGRIPNGPKVTSQAEAAQASVLGAVFDALETHAASPEFQTTFDHVIWSNEVLAMRPDAQSTIDALAAFAARSRVFTSVEIILVFRRQDDWLEAAYRQWALQNKVDQGHKTLTPMQYAERDARLLDYHAIYSQWSEAFPTQVATFNDVKAKGGIVEYFCDVWGLPSPPNARKYHGVRGAVGPALSTLYSYFHRAYPAPGQSRVFDKFVQKYRLPELSAPDQVCVSDEVRRAVLENAATGNEALAHILERDALFPPPPDIGVAVYDTAEADMTSYLLRITKAQSEELDRLRDRIIALEAAGAASKAPLE
jgi:hypothetical protein